MYETILGGLKRKETESGACKINSGSKLDSALKTGYRTDVTKRICRSSLTALNW